MASAESSPEEPDLSHELPASLLFVPTLNTGSTKQGFHKVKNKQTNKNWEKKKKNYQLS